MTKKRPAQLAVSWIPPEPGGIEWIDDPVSDDVDGEGKSRSDGEEIIYVHCGSLAQEDSMGRSEVIQAGEFQRITGRRRVRHSESNASQVDSAHVNTASVACTSGEA